MQIQSFSMNRTPVGQRPEAFRREMQDRFSIALAVRGLPDAPLETSVRAYCGHRLRFADLRFSPHRTSAAHQGRADSRFLLTYQLEGRAFVSQDGRECCVEPGHFCVIDPSMSFSIETTEIHARSIYLERQSILAVAPYIQLVTARSIDGRAGPGALIRATLEELFSLAPSMDEAMADTMADALPHNLAVALHSLGRNLRPGLPRLQLFHKKRVLSFARQYLHDPALDPRCIAAAVNLSLRYIYDLFADDELPLMKWVWKERLQNAQRDLAAAHSSGRSVAEIAYSWGFSNVAHFSRAFRQQFGLTPRQCRYGQGRRDSTPTAI